MCAICGCSGATANHVNHVHDEQDPRDPHELHDPHLHDDPHGHDAHQGQAGRTRHLERAILARNDQLAGGNRRWLGARGLVALNFVSAPGAGKTTLLERTIRDLGPSIPIVVIEGDQETENDAHRIRAAGATAVQINTGAGCHLDAAMVGKALRHLDPETGSLVAIENVGNLVCPALFDLGEEAKVVLASITDGEDKPVKYPYMFRAAEVMVVNKVDLLPHLRFDLPRFLALAAEVNPRQRVFQVSATRGDGLEAWYGWLRERLRAARHAPATQRMP